MEYIPRAVMATWIKPKMPLEMNWRPLLDITAYELALCIPFMLKSIPIYPGDIDVNEPHFRHFEIINHNK